MKKASAVIAGLMWKPFDSRFQDLLQTMEEHRKLLFDELSILSISMNLKHFNLMSKDQQTLEIDHVLTADERIQLQREQYLCAHSSENIEQIRSLEQNYKGTFLG